jgi:hypothetical protein
LELPAIEVDATMEIDAAIVNWKIQEGLWEASYGKM